MERLLLLGITLTVFVPLVIRYVITPLIVRDLIRKHLASELTDLRAGWEHEQDREAVELLVAHVGSKLRPKEAFHADPLNDVRELILTLEQHYFPEQEGAEEPNFEFPIRRLFEGSLVILDDLLNDYGDQWWFRKLVQVRIKHIQRAGTLNRQFRSFRDRVRTFVGDIRVLSAALAVLVYAVLGLPITLFVILRTFLIAGLHEGFVRFAYGLFLLRCGHLAVYVYAGANERFADRYRTIEKNMLVEAAREREAKVNTELKEACAVSPMDQAASVANNLYRTWGLAPDTLTHETPSNKRSMMEHGKRIVQSSLQAFRPSESGGSSSPSIGSQLTELHTGIAAAAYEGNATPFAELRAADLLQGAVSASLLGLKTLYTVPGAQTLAGKVTLRRVLDAKRLLETENVQMAISGGKRGWRWWRMARRVQQGTRIARGAGGPLPLIASFGLSAVGYNVKDLSRAHLLHRCGRVLLEVYVRSLRESGDIPEEILPASTRA